MDSNTSAEGAEEHAPTDGEMQRHRVAPEMPRYLRIPSISVSARIQRMGINSKGDVAAPRNIQDTGWYEDSARPGEPGTSFIDGHVNRPSLPGVFARLHELKAGDEIVIERGDGKTLSYQVSTSETKKVQEIDMAAVLGPHGPEQTLVLMTCAGTLNPALRTYDSREIIFANRTMGR